MGDRARPGAADRAARSRNLLYQSLVESAPDAVLVVDDAGQILLANARATVVFGYPRDEMLGLPVDLLVPARVRAGHPGQRTRYAESDRRTRPMGAGLQLSAVRRDGVEFPVDVALSTTTIGGQRLVTVIVRDVTERQQLEAELRTAKAMADAANLAKSEFLSRMSHELRTPLNAVIGFAQLLELDELTGEQAESVSHILKAGRHLLALIDEVLDIARIESGQLALSVEPVPTGVLLGEVADLVRPTAAERAITVLVPAAGSCPFVLADHQRLKQVVLNLLSNAVKYNRRGGRVDVGCASDGTGLVAIAVRDTGPGIPEHLLDRLFVPFDRLGAEHTGVEGSGVGLTISQKFTEAMGGRLTVESTVGQGSTFTVTLRGAPDSAVDLPDQPASNRPATRRVLYVEDNLSNLRLMERIVALRAEFELRHAISGGLGVQLATAAPPDLVLLDLHLPDMTGEEVLARLRSDARTATIPVYVVSADATKSTQRALAAAGVAGYLTKPIDVSAVLTVLDTLPERQ